MPTMCYLTIPATEIKTATDSVLWAVTKYVTGRFPPRVIKQTFVDVQDKMRDFYKNALTYYGGNKNVFNGEEMIKTPKPHLFVGYTFDSSFESTETGLGETQPYMLPSAFFLQERMQSVHPIIVDNDRRIIVGTQNLRIRVTAEFVITCDNRDDQFQIYNYCLNYLKMYYLMALQGIKASFIMPDYLMTLLKDMMYGPEMEFDKVFDDFAKYIKDHSDNGVYPVYRNNNKDDKYFEMKYIYRQVDFRLSGKPQMDEGNQKDNASDLYTVRFPAEIQFYIPSNFIIKCPEMIPNGVGHTFVMPNVLKLDSVSDNELYHHVKNVIKRVEDEFVMKEPLLWEKGFDKYLRYEFTLVDKEDSFNLKDVCDDNMKIILDFIIDRKLFHLVKVFLYEENRILDGNYFEMDEKMNCFIHKGNVLKVHILEVYIKTAEIEKLLSKIKKGDVV